MRYIFYRAHKYVLYAVTELERLIAKTDFTSDDAVDKIKNELGNARPIPFSRLAPVIKTTELFTVIFDIYASLRNNSH